ncbi:MAG: lipocalin family protein [Bdellovibrionia bacterium]
METVPSVDLSRYLGKWYEIARFPNSFQKDCTDATAEYTMT